MKTPEEIKRALKSCSSDDCRDCCYYKHKATCQQELALDALEYIRAMEAEVQKLKRYNGWKSVEEEEPTEYGEHLVLYEDLTTDTMYFNPAEKKGERWGTYQELYATIDGKLKHETRWLVLHPAYWIDDPTRGG